MKIDKKISVVIILELLVLVFLVYRLNHRWNRVESASISILNKEDLIFSDSGALKSFYESTPNLVSQRKEDNPPWLDYVPEIRTNSDTINAQFDFEEKKPKGFFRIVILGDSWTFGQHVSTKDNYSSRLMDMLNGEPRCSQKKFEVLNLGVAGYDLRYAVERFKLRGQKYDPDLVIWAIHKNDFEEINEFLFPKIKAYMEEFKRQNVSDSDYTDSSGNIKASPKYVVLAWEKAIKDQNKEIGQKDLLQYQTKTLESIRDIYKGPLLLYTWSKIIGPSGEAQDIMVDFVRTFDNFYYYPSTLSLEKEDHLADFHPSAKGHEKIAVDLFDYLKENGLVPCSQG